MMSGTRADHESRLNEERRRAERGKHLVVLMLNHLLQMGYTGSVDALQSESGLSLSQYEVADNVDLVSILQEWEDYYEMRFQRRAKVVKKLSAYSDRVDPHGAKGARRALEAAVGSRGGRARSGLPSVKRNGSATAVDDDDDGAAHDPTTAGSGACAARLSRQPKPEGGHAGTAAERALAALGAAGGAGGAGAAGASSHSGGRTTPKAGSARGAGHAVGTDTMCTNGIAVTGTHVCAARGGEAGGDDAPGPWENRLRKAGLPPAMAASTELRELASIIQRDMVQTNPNIRWDAIAELDGVKRVLKESLVMPLRWPHLFTGLLAPWKGVLLYGPPGTGKTLLAKAVATECSTVFFNISASSIVSKWRGDSEKLVRVLFELARHHSPSTIFIDEIDSIMSARGDSGEHEGSRRMKTELLVQMDGLMANDAQVFVLAATNLPWELDSALLRRLEKRVLVPLPSASARALMLRNTLPADRLADHIDLDSIALAADGYSGSDLVLVCKEAAMRPLRKLLSRLDAAPPAIGGRDGALPQPERVREEDLRAALACTRPTVSQFGARYKEWEAEFGSV